MPSQITILKWRLPSQLLTRPQAQATPCRPLSRISGLGWPSKVPTSASPDDEHRGASGRATCPVRSALSFATPVYRPGTDTQPYRACQRRYGNFSQLTPGPLVLRCSGQKLRRGMWALHTFGVMPGTSRTVRSGGKVALETTATTTPNNTLNIQIKAVEALQPLLPLHPSQSS